MKQNLIYRRYIEGLHIIGIRNQRRTEQRILTEGIKNVLAQVFNRNYPCEGFHVITVVFLCLGRRSGPCK